MINALTDFIKTLWYKIFTLSESKAIKIAGHYTGLKADNSWKIYPCAQNNWYVYNIDSLKNCWFIICPWGDGLDGMMLRSSWIVCVSKKNGNILLDCSAQDEG